MADVRGNVSTGHSGEEVSDPSSTNTSQCTTGGSSGAASLPRRNRLMLFNKVMEKSLERLIADASFHRFAKTFHPFYKHQPQLTDNIHRQFVSELRQAVQDDIAQLMDEGSLQCKLEELDQLEEAARDVAEPAWRPSGVPQEDLCSFVMPYYLKQREYLTRRLKKLQKENAALAQRVQAGREAIAQTEQRVTAALDQWKASASELDTLGTLSPFQNFGIP